MKKTVIKGIILLIIFFAGIYVLGRFKNYEETDTTIAMEEATLPVIYLTSFGQTVNELHGYVNDMEANYMRDTITPLDSERELPITINKYSSGIKSVSYEVRSLDTTRLVEETEVLNYEETDDTIRATLNIKNLIEDNHEYILKINLSTESGKNIYYYTRIIKNEDLYVKEKVEFAKDFSNKTFDKSEAEELVIYLESNSLGDNSTFNRVTINSNFEQVTWGNLSPDKVTEPVVSIKEIDRQTASLVLKYIVSVEDPESKVIEYFNIREYYRVRYTQERMYMLDFERGMEQIFDPEAFVFNENRINLGIAKSSVEYEDSDNGNIAAFVREGDLYAVNVDSNNIIRLFSFRNGLNNLSDTRNNYDQHDIKILDVDDEGNISFAVYGYMNRGEHEGEVGVNVFIYNGAAKVLEEKAFIPVSRSYQIVKESAERLMHLNSNNKLYIEIEDSIYNVDLETGSYSEIAENLNEYVISGNGSILAWHNAENISECRVINIVNLETGARSTVEADEGESIKPIGFMDDDFIYGTAKVDDIMNDESGTTIFPMYSIKILAPDNSLIEEYSKEDIYVVNASISGNAITLERAVKSDTGYSGISKGSLMNNEERQEGKTELNLVVTERKESQMQIKLYTNFSESRQILLNPKLLKDNKDTTINIKSSKEQAVKYYVYGKGQLKGIYSDVSDAVKEADDLAGVVVSSNQEYIWERGNRLIRTQINGINGSAAENKSSLSLCLDTILELFDINVDSAALLNRGENAVSILSEYIDALVFNLNGVSLSSALYYVSRGTPVLAVNDTGTYVLIIGYDELNTIIMNPDTGKVYKVGMNDSTQMFEEGGSKFIAYLKKE